MENNSIFREVTYNNKITCEEAIKKGKNLGVGTVFMAKKWNCSYLEAEHRLGNGNEQRGNNQ